MIEYKTKRGSHRQGCVNFIVTKRVGKKNHGSNGQNIHVLLVKSQSYYLFYTKSHTDVFIKKLTPTMSDQKIFPPT